MNKQYSDDLHSLSHTKWNCKYHVVFAPKYRRKAFYDARRVEIGSILRRLCEWKGINIIEAEVCIGHVHMLIEIPPKYSVSGIMGFLKGKSSQMIYERWANARYKYRHGLFWCRGYYVDTVGKNTKKIKEYIAFKKRYITKDLFTANLESIKREKTHYLFYHPLQEHEKMVESYVLFGKCTYKDNDEKTICSLKNVFTVTERSVLNYYKDAERFIDYKNRTTFNSVSKFI